MKRIYGFAVLSVAALLLFRLVPAGESELRGEMIRASRTMARAIDAVRACRLEGGVPIDRSVDVNATGLIGPENSPLTTSLGHLGAKRTSTNPNMAGLMVYLLRSAGVRGGDAVAVGASGSFPALIIASVAAIRTIGAEPLVISSIGASEYGASEPRFHWIDMEECLRRRGIWTFRSIAHSVGGEGDLGGDLAPEGLEIARAALRGSGEPVIGEPSLPANVAARLGAYDAAARGRRIAAFVNVGGSWANLGTDASVLELKPGLAEAVPRAAPESRGAIGAMAARGIPIVHLLNIRGLAERHGLPWDPSPLPEPGEGELYLSLRAGGPGRAVIALAYLAIVLAAAVFYRRPFIEPS